MTVQEFGRALREGPYAWPGGYPIFFVTNDGGALSFATAWNERALIVDAILRDDRHGGWRVVGADVNWEDPDLIDDHTGKRIESAYAEDEAKGEPEKTPASYSAWWKRSRG